MVIEQRSQWYHDFLMLPNTGFVPFECARHIYPKAVCRGRLGTSNDKGGYAWRHYFEPDYQKYIEELYERVHQKKLRGDEYLPWHFTRGVLAEFDGEAVNWAKYATSMRRKGLQNEPPKILPKYRKPRRPIPWSNPRPIEHQPSVDSLFVCSRLRPYFSTS